MLPAHRSALAYRCRFLLVPVLAFALLLAGAHSVPADSTYHYVYISDADQIAYQHPAELRFSEDGDLVGAKLRWRGWGSATSTASGYFRFRVTPRDIVTLKGSVTAYDPQQLCPANETGTSYDGFYDKVRFDIPRNPFHLKPQAMGVPIYHTACVDAPGS